MRVKLLVVSLACLAVLWLSVPALAQGELSLEGLAAQIRDLTERVAFIESMWSGPGSP